MSALHNLATTVTVSDTPLKLSGERCFHCFEPLPKFCDIQADINGVSKPMCCYGCKAAAEYIQQQDLSKFYSHRERSGLQRRFARGDIASHSQSNSENWSFLDRPETASHYVTINPEGERKLSLQVHGLYCSSCSWLIDKALKRVSESIQVRIELDAKRIHLVVPATVSSENTPIKLSMLLELISCLGYQPNPLPLSPGYDDVDVINTHEKHQFIKRILVSGLGMMQVMTYAIALYLGEFQGMDEAHRKFLTLVSMLVATVVVFYAGQPFFRNAYNDLKNQHFGMDVPIALAIGGAYFPSVYNTLAQSSHNVYFDSAVMFIFLLTTGRFLEMRARHRLSAAPAALMRLLPNCIKVDRHVGSDVTTPYIRPQEVQLNDRLELQSGQVVPFDARVRSGCVSVDESLLTGEARAVDKNTGDRLLAGSRVQGGKVSIEATHLWQDSSIVKIENLLQTGRNPNTLQFSGLQKLSRNFVMAVLSLTLLVGGFWWFYQADRAFDIVLAMLIASCPCAFALAIPVGQAAASNTLRECGILLAKPNALKLVSQISSWCFDKTGTLTDGRTQIRQVNCLGERSETECLTLMAALQTQSNHAIANAFATIETNLVADSVREFPGRGISGFINGERYYVGKPSWVSSKVGMQIHDKELEPSLELSECALASDHQLLAIVSFNDELRDGGEAYLNFLKSGAIRSIILSGDKQAAVDACASRLPVDEAIGDLLPKQKLNFLKAKQAQGGKVAMLGDGINDAPVLSQADLSIALSSGSELSQSQADIVLLNGRLDRLISLHRVAKKTHGVTQQNLLWASCYNLLVLPMAAFGFLTPWLAALGMSISSLLVVSNALRIRSTAVV